MPVLENMEINGISSSSNRAESDASNDVDQVQLNQALMQLNGGSPLRSNDEISKAIVNPDDNRHDQQQKLPLPPHSSSDVDPEVQGAAVVQNGSQTYQLADELHRNVGDNLDRGFKREIRGLEEMISKLNPLAAEFIPPWMTNHRAGPPAGVQLAYANNFLMQPASIVFNGNTVRRKKNGYSHGKRSMNTHTSMAQQQDAVKKTVYVSEIDHMVTEEQLATLFVNCGQVIDCRICGDPNSILRFAFVEFTDEEGSRNALSLSGTMLGYYPVKILPSKTAIAPVNPTLLPRSEDEREMCVRTIYCTNIDKKVTQADVKFFFESNCGEVHRLRLLGDYHHSTRIAFVEFIMAESAIAALNCSGIVLGSLPIRVSPSKTPVRPRAPRTPMQ